ncbi:hypothetical protein H8E88_14700 [candidate division KSB1 bacterium]|nr:hypothetical protein [candidate division KSB1 bacterium]MBL7094569.1 hypothetical protein [candidate division KSB1 bacterium]
MLWLIQGNKISVTVLRGFASNQQVTREGDKEMGREGEEAIKFLGYFSAFMFSPSPFHPLLLNGMIRKIIKWTN